MAGDRPFARILVPLDGSPFAEAAYYPALALARHVGVPLTLFGVPHDAFDRESLMSEVNELGSAIPHEAVVDIVIDRGSEAAFDMEGYIADAIVDQADASRALICLASHGRSGPGAALLGSMTHLVLRRSARPVLVVGPRCARGIAFDEGTVVACLDRSPFAASALPVAEVWSTVLRLPLCLVHVTERDTATASDLAPCDGGTASAYLQRLEGRYPGAESELVRGRDVARQLVQLSRRRPVAVMVMATHAYSGWTRLALGNVAMDVVRRAACPIVMTSKAARAAVSRTQHAMWRP